LTARGTTCVGERGRWNAPENAAAGVGVCDGVPDGVSACRRGSDVYHTQGAANRPQSRGQCSAVVAQGSQGDRRVERVA
jgi:hypothetical protein